MYDILLKAYASSTCNADAVANELRYPAHFAKMMESEGVVATIILISFRYG